MPICRIYDSTGKELTQCSTGAFPSHSKIYFGRSSQCEVCLKSQAETSISRQHFYIQENLGGGWTIYDNNSRAGIIQDGQKVKSAALYDGSIIRFGMLFFAFGERGVPSHYRLKWMGTDGKEHRGTLWEGVNTVGASRDNYVTVREGDISRFHAHFTVRGASISVAAVNSMLELDVNGEHVDGAVMLKAGDSVALAGFPVDVEYIDIAEKHAPVVLSAEEVSLHNRNRRRERQTSYIITLCFLGAFILFLLALGWMAMRWLPGAR